MEREPFWAIPKIPFRIRLPGFALEGVDFSRVDFAKADLRGTVFRGADLSGSDFRDADLSGADLRGADLTGALNLTLEQLSSALIDDGTRLPEGVDRGALVAAGEDAA